MGVCAGAHLLPRAAPRAAAPQRRPASPGAPWRPARGAASASSPAGGPSQLPAPTAPSMRLSAPRTCTCQRKPFTCCSCTTLNCVPAQHRIRSRLPMQLGALLLTPLLYLFQQPWCLPPAHAHPMPLSHVLLLPASQAHRIQMQRKIMQCSKQPSRAVSMEPATGHPCRETASCPAPKPMCTFMACRLSDGREAEEMVPHPSR